MAMTTKVYANMLAECSGFRLDKERLRRIADAKTLADAFKMLADYGFSYTDGASVDEFVTGETDALIAFVRDTAASAALEKALLARFVYNNAKLAYKSRFHEMPRSGYYSVDFDAQKIADGDYDEADPYMRAALCELDEEKETRPQRIDLALTRAMYKYVLSCGAFGIKKYFRAEIDMKNILSAARKKRLKLDTEEYIHGGTISEQALDEATRGEGFSEYFENTPYAEFAANIEDNGFAELWRAERDADEYLFGLTDGAVKAFTSNTPFLNYYTSALIELKTIKTALVCIKTGVRDEIFTRLSGIYD